MKYIKNFKDITIKDIPLVGGKNASLGEMIHFLEPKGILIPGGFAITSEAYWLYLNENKILDKIKSLINQLIDKNDLNKLEDIGKQIRNLILSGTIPAVLKKEIENAYSELNCNVAVRSSATAEDLPSASFAGQQETFLNVKNITQLLESYKKSLASLFTNRAIIYRIENNFDHFKVGLSTGVQKMLSADSSGVAFSLDTETGFRDVITIDSAFGIGESIVQGEVIPDEFQVHKPTLRLNYQPIIKKFLGTKEIKTVYAEDSGIKKIPLKENSFSLNDKDIIDLAKQVLIIEEHYSQKTWVPMDVEWAKEGDKIYILQARPETVHSQKKHTPTLIQYILKNKPSPIIKGQSIGQKIVSGKVRIIKELKQISEFKKGEILVTTMTDPNWLPIMKSAAAIITDRGGKTCHAAIVSRELGIPAIIGTEIATTILKDGQELTLDCSQGSTGYVYPGLLKFEETKIELSSLPKPPVNIMLNVFEPEEAFTLSFLPNSGVGLARIEFIISNLIKIHPMALIFPEKVTDKEVLTKINNLTAYYQDKKDFFIDNMALGIGKIAAAFYPKLVVVRLSDFKSNEYRSLIGGTFFEPVEENPMIGLRGTSRYYNKLYKPAFALECMAIKKAREIMGLTNIIVMLPFVRTVEEAKLALEEMKRNNLVPGANGLKVYMMCEIPSNVFLMDEFSKLFDGFSIGSNDLTQFILGVDRDSELLTDIFNEQNPAVKKALEMAIAGALKNKKEIGICGEAPSNYPDLAKFLIEKGISYLSLNPDSVIKLITSL